MSRPDNYKLIMVGVLCVGFGFGSVVTIIANCISMC